MTAMLIKNVMRKKTYAGPRPLKKAFFSSPWKPFRKDWSAP